jgi:hypothetical protein
VLLRTECSQTQRLRWRRMSVASGRGAVRREVTIWEARVCSPGGVASSGRRRVIALCHLAILLRCLGLFVYLRLLQMTLPSEFIVADQCAGNRFGFASKRPKSCSRVTSRSSLSVMPFSRSIGEGSISKDRIARGSSGSGFDCPLCPPTRTGHEAHR